MKTQTNNKITEVYPFFRPKVKETKVDKISGACFLWQEGIACQACNDDKAKIFSLRNLPQLIEMLQMMFLFDLDSVCKSHKSFFLEWAHRCLQNGVIKNSPICSIPQRIETLQIAHVCTQSNHLKVGV